MVDEEKNVHLVEIFTSIFYKTQKIVSGAKKNRDYKTGKSFISFL